jgi:hypothetical protein
MYLISLPHLMELLSIGTLLLCDAPPAWCVVTKHGSNDTLWLASQSRRACRWQGPQSLSILIYP